MGVVTTFDEKREAAKKDLANAIKNLQECTNEDTYGYSDMRHSFIDDLIQMIAELIIMKRRL